LPLFFLLSPAHLHDAPFSKRLLAWAVQLYQIRPRIVRLDAAYWGLYLIAWIHAVLGAVAAHVMRNEILASKQKSEACSFDLTSGRGEERGKKKHITRSVWQKA
jgi:hypothetical protein